MVDLPECSYPTGEAPGNTIAGACYTPPTEPYNSVTHLGPTYFLFSAMRWGGVKRKCHFCGAVHNILTFLLQSIQLSQHRSELISSSHTRAHTQLLLVWFL